MFKHSFGHVSLHQILFPFLPMVSMQREKVCTGNFLESIGCYALLHKCREMKWLVLG
jgi:hypothetical protein